MDNCDLEKLSVSGAKLHPAFTPDVTDYKVTVESSVNKVTLDLMTSDCGASYSILCGDGSSTIKLNDGLNRVEIEVVAEDGTIKKYCVEITRLSAKIAELSNLDLEGDIQLYPAFCSKIYEYSCIVPFHCSAVTILPKVLDKNIKVTVNVEDSSQQVPLNFGDTVVEISVCSADGSNSQVYKVLVTRKLIPMAVTFTDEKLQLDYECPVSLTALYRPVSINHSDPKHIFSRPYIEMLARRSKVDPLSDCPLGDGWKVVELDLDRRMSAALVKCFFTYRGCDSVMKLSELGSHSLDCPHKSTGELDAKDVTETSWYKKHFASSSCLEIETKHNVEFRKWEKRLQMTAGEDSVDKLCALAQDQLRLYRKHLPKPGDTLQYEDGQSPLHSLEQAAVHYASAIRLSSKDARLHFLLGVVLEEQHYATEMFGLQRKADKDDFSDAKSTARQDDILAVCKLHGYLGTPTVQNQLQALDKEYQLLKEQGQSSKADYVQTLYVWLSKKTGKDNSAAMQDEETSVHRALMKYLDAWSLSPDSWEYNLHVGRLLLLQGRSREALQHLQSGLALRPLHPGLRYFTGLALLQQEQKASEDTEREAALFLQQGLEHFVSQRCSKSWVEQDPSDPLSSLSTQFLRGLLSLGQLQQRNTLSGKAMSAEQVYHTVAVLTAQSVSQCVCRGEASGQLEWVLLDAQFALLQRLIQQGERQAKAGTERQSLVAKRCRALTALIRLTSIAPCQELLDMQERACQLAVVTTPRDSHALCLLGLAQLAQYDNNPNADKSKEFITDACLSFKGSIELEDKTQSGEPPEQLSKQKWWRDRQQAENEKAATQSSTQPAGVKGPSDTSVAKRGAKRGRGGPGQGRLAAAGTRAPAPSSSAPTRGGKAARPPAKTPAARGRAGAATKPDKSFKPSNNGPKPQLPASKSKQDCCSDTAEAVEEPTVAEQNVEGPVNRRSHTTRLGLARALSRSADTQDQAKQLYQEVISMAPGVHDAYSELVQLLEPSDPQAAVEVYCRFPLKPAAEQSFDDAYISGEIVRILMRLEQYDHPQLGPSLVAYGKVMGLSCIEKYIDILDGKAMSKLLKSVYARIHDREEDDQDLQDFFKFKCWI
ncbi:uncharacterized protein AB9X84_021428 [Acanthopagrus schlegelii]